MPQRPALTKSQLMVRDFLAEKGASAGVVGKIAGTGNSGAARRPRLRHAEAKVAFFESIRLDPARYGFERMPVSVYEKFLHLPLSDIRHSMAREILWPLENAHANRVLSREWPAWGRAKTGALKRFRPARVLERFKAAVANGYKPTVWLIQNSTAAGIAAGKATAVHAVDDSAVRAASGKLRFGAGLLPIKEPEANIRARQAVVSAILSSPTRAVHRGWLFRHMAEEHGMAGSKLHKVLEQLSDLGIISRQNGHVRISQLFRTGTNSPEAHKAAINRRLANAETAARKRGKRQRAAG